MILNTIKMKKRLGYLPPQCDLVSVRNEISFLASADEDYSTNTGIEDILIDGFDTIW
jgi:hypothetical protein